MMREGFAGEAFSGYEGEGDGYTSQQKYKGMRKMERGAQLANNEFVYDNISMPNYED